MMFKSCMGVLLWLFLPVSLATAQQFTSPRATALGSYVAVSDDIFGLDWNASAMAFANAKLQVSFTNLSTRENILSAFDNFGASLKLGGRHVIAFRKTPYFGGALGIEKTPIAQRPEDVTAYDALAFMVLEQDLSFGYTFKLLPNLAFGANTTRFKYRSNLRSANEFWSFGFSASYILNDHLRFGVVSHNTFLEQYKHHTDRVRVRFPEEPDITILNLNLDAVPLIQTRPQWRLDFGAAARPWHNLLLSFDLSTDGGVGLGLEWEALKGFYLRQGLSNRSDRLFKPEKFSALATGLGLRYGIARFDFTVYHGNTDRKVAFVSSSVGDFNVSSSTTGRIVLLSALFFVK